MAHSLSTLTTRGIYGSADDYLATISTRGYYSGTLEGDVLIEAQELADKYTARELVELYVAQELADKYTAREKP